MKKDKNPRVKKVKAEKVNSEKKEGFFSRLKYKLIDDENSFIRKYYIRFFERKESTYGLQFSVKYYITFYLVSIIVVLLVAMLSQLKWKYIAVLLAVMTLMFPVIMIAVIMQKNEIKRFEMVTSYLTNVLPIFMQNTKILWTLKEIEGLLDHKIKKVVREAIDYIENNTTDPEAEATALKYIEEEFPNTRVIAVNRLMLSIEKDNSVDYKDSCMTMYDDVESWVDRVYEYQKDLANRKVQLALLCILTVAMNVLFISMYQSNDFFKGFGQNSIYQIITTLFLISIILVVTATLTKLHGTWIVNDYTEENIEKIENAYRKLNQGKSKIRKVDIIVGAILMVLAAFMIIVMKQRLIGLIIVVLALMIVFFKLIQKDGYERTIKKAFEVEFPLWLRNISLYLYSMTVLRAVERSKETSPKFFAEELNKLQSEAEKNPTALKPYAEFLSQYKIEATGSAMRVLYSIQNLGTEDIKTQVSGLVVRNQKMLQKSEQIRNKDNISSVELLGYLPMILFSVQMLVSLALLVMTVLGKMSIDLVW